MANDCDGYIRLFRRLRDWGWYKDSATLHIFVHILLSANFRAGVFRGQTIARGQLVTSYQSLATETGLSVQNVRTAIRHLKSTGEITMQAHHTYSIITVPKYDAYQTDQHQTNTPTNKQLTSHQQAANRPLTTIEKGKKGKREEKEPPVSPYEAYEFSDGMRQKLDEWQAYKRENGKKYKPIGLNNLLKTVSREIDRLGERAVINRITEAMGSGWMGMNLDKLTGPRNAASVTGGSGNVFADLAREWEDET